MLLQTFVILFISQVYHKNVLIIQWRSMESNQCCFGPQWLSLYGQKKKKNPSKYIFLHFPLKKESHKSWNNMSVRKWWLFIFGWNIPRNAILPHHQTDWDWFQLLHWNTADAVCLSHPASLRCLCSIKNIQQTRICVTLTDACDHIVQVFTIRSNPLLNL